MRNIKAISFIIILLIFGSSCQRYYSIVNYQSNQISVDSTGIKKTDSSLVEIYQPYKNKIEDSLNTVISNSTAQMERNSPESLLTNFVSDLLLVESRKYCKQEDLPIPSIAIMNKFGLRAPIPKGEVTIENAFKVMPFENQLAILVLPAASIQELCNRIARNEGEGVAGISFGIKEGKAINVKINGENLSESGEYTLATNDYLAKGGSNLFRNLPISKSYFTKKMIREAIIDYMKEKHAQGEKLTASLDNRIYYAE